MGDDVFVLIPVGIFAWSMMCLKFRAALSDILRALGR